jgi:histidyl-tRNA synthetase
MPVKISDRLEKVKGMNDVLPGEYAGSETVLAWLKHSFKAFGYHALDVPVVEHTDLYLRKAGEDIIARLYDFTFQSRRLCLRPEMTASIIRAYIDNLQASALPVRLCYAGPVFRYEKPQRGRQRQFTQAGVELIGAAGPLADAEVIALACRGLDALGLTGYQVVIGHVGILGRFLEGLQLEGRLRDFLLTNIELMRSRGPQAVRERLPAVFPSLATAEALPTDAVPSGLENVLADLDEPAARAMVLDLLKSMEFELLSSSRSEEEIVSRLLAKIRRRDQAPRVEQALVFLSRLCQLSGAPAAVFEQAEALLSGYNLGLEPMHELRAIIDTLAAYDLDLSKITLDLGLSRGLQYYTGMIFEIYHGSPGDERQLAGGGRYDDLVLTLGGRKSVPGCGFSYGLERIQLALQDEGRLQPAAPAADLLVIPVSPAESADAIRTAEALRKAGLAVEVDVRGRSVTSNLQYANGRRIPFAVVVGSDELVSGLLRLKTMSSGAEQRLSIADVISTVRKVDPKEKPHEG